MKQRSKKTLKQFKEIIENTVSMKQEQNGIWKEGKKERMKERRIEGRRKKEKKKVPFFLNYLEYLYDS